MNLRRVLLSLLLPYSSLSFTSKHSSAAGDAFLLRDKTVTTLCEQLSKGTQQIAFYYEQHLPATIQAYPSVCRPTGAWRWFAGGLPARGVCGK